MHLSLNVADDEIKAVIAALLSGLVYTFPQTPPNTDLRQRLAAEIAAWNITLSPTFQENILVESCIITETSYSHTSAAHQYYIALYTACSIYADDHGAANPASVGEFSQRFANNRKQLDPVFDRYAALLRNTHALWPAVAANAIVCAALDFMTAVYVECMTGKMAISPHAKRYPYHLRLMSGASPAYSHFIFPGHWRASVESYIQLIPELNFYVNCLNDVLSFYKESIAAEPANYISLRAVVEQQTAFTVLRELSAELLDTVRRIDEMTAGDHELAAVCRGFIQGYVEFHVRTPRYRLGELGVDV